MVAPVAPDPARARLADAIGLVLVASTALWVAVAAGGGEGRRAPVLALLAGATGAVVLGRALAARAPLVPRLVALGVAGALVLTWPGLLEVTGPPTGYANANATLTALGALASLGAARDARKGAEQRAWVGLAAVLGVATAAPTSLAGVLCLAAAVGLVGSAALGVQPRVVVAGGLVATSSVLAVTAAIAAGADPAGLGERSEVRGELWTAAVEVLRHEPVRGVGPGRFEEVNPVSDDRDLRWAHHGYLQVAAEWGAPGLVLVLGLVGWTWGRLWLSAGGRDPTPVLGAAAALVVGLHAMVDYVWHVPVVLLVLAVLVGDATGRPGWRTRRPPGRRGVAAPAGRAVGSSAAS